jgi:hypothetical protein
MRSKVQLVENGGGFFRCEMHILSISRELRLVLIDEPSTAKRMRLARHYKMNYGSLNELGFICYGLPQDAARRRTARR